jgi:hypothetical protein
LTFVFRKMYEAHQTKYVDKSAEGYSKSLYFFKDD